MRHDSMRVMIGAALAAIALLAASCKNAEPTYSPDAGLPRAAEQARPTEPYLENLPPTATPSTTPSR